MATAKKEWIEFKECTSTKKTKSFAVLTLSKPVQMLGWVKWYAPWRKYAFFPKEFTVYETDCLKLITTFIDQLMVERKVEKQNKQQKSF